MSARVATTANITLTNATTTVDGVTLTNGDLVLVKNQTTGTENGIYVANTSGTWSRSDILPVGMSAVGVIYYIVSGNINGKDSFVCTSNPAVVGTNSLVFGLYNTNLKLAWNAPAHGNPVTGQPINATLGGNASYTGVLDGIQLTPNTTGQLGYANWIVTGFDFTRDFELAVCFFQGTGADGVQFGVGGSSAFTSATTANGGLAFSYNTFSSNQNSRFYVNGATVGNLVIFHSGITYTNVWMTSRLSVRTYGTKRTAILLTGNDNCLENSYDVTSWVPAGAYVGVMGRSGGTAGLHVCNTVTLSYI